MVLLMSIAGGMYISKLPSAQDSIISTTFSWEKRAMQQLSQRLPGSGMRNESTARDSQNTFRRLVQNWVSLWTEQGFYCFKTFSMASYLKAIITLKPNDLTLVILYLEHGTLGSHISLRWDPCTYETAILDWGSSKNC